MPYLAPNVDNGIGSADRWWLTNGDLSSAQEATVDLAGTTTLKSLPLQSGVMQLCRVVGQTISVPIKQGKFQLAAKPH